MDIHVLFYSEVNQSGHVGEWYWMYLRSKKQTNMNPKLAQGKSDEYRYRTKHEGLDFFLQHMNNQSDCPKRPKGHWDLRALITYV